MHGLLRDLRDGVRQWTRTPIVSLVVITSLAIGIGANTAIFSLLDALLLRPLPVSRPDQLVRVQEQDFSFQSYPVWQYLHTRTSILSPFAAMSLMRPDISSTAERRSALGLAVSGSFFDMLGVRPVLGRLIREDDDRADGRANVVVLEYQFWQRAYNGADVVGTTIPLDGRPFTIIGVVQRGFFGINVGRRFDLAVPLEGFRLISPGIADPLSASLTVFGRLGSGQSIAAASAALQAAQIDLRSSLEVPAAYARLRAPLTLVPMGMGLTTDTQQRYAAPLRILQAIVAIVLLVACANVANLLLARGAARRSELATRLSLGATTWGVLRPLAAESLVIALASAVAGVLVGLLTAHAIVSTVAVDSANTFATWIDISLNARVLAFTTTLGVLTAVVFGLGPALWNVRVDPLDAMRQRARGIAGPPRAVLTHAVLVMQIALALVLVMGGLLLVNSFVRLTTQDLGFARGALIVAVPDYNRSSVSRIDRVPASDRIRAELARLPGVRSTSFAESTPFGFGQRPWPVSVAGRSGPEGDAVNVSRVGTGHFANLGMTMLAGRDFAMTGLESTGVAVVNEAFARKYFDGANPVGRAIAVRMPNRGQMDIVGLVADARDMSVRDAVPPTVYIPLIAADEPWIEIAVRADADSDALRRAILDTITRQATGARVEFRTVAAGLAAASARDRIIAWLAGGFAGLAVLLYAIGLYGVMAYHVSRRRHEFGVRIAVGAAPSAVIALVLRQSASIVGSGVFLGVVVSLAAGRGVEALLFDTSPADMRVMAMAVVLLGGGCLVAGVIPARRASRIDPMTALREE